MSEDCIFCQIVAGDIPSRSVYEDDDAFAFLDANPMAPGHTLVVPKEHHETLADLPEDAGAAVFAALHRLTPVVEDAVDADASTVAFNNGEAAGQEVGHVHGHIIPRFDGDGGGPVHAVAGARPDLDDDELDAIADRIANAAD
ncbi:HIT family protein [Halorubellus sp. JP-L1]|uniref:HIT family protein n=1 Tax=Halorubellus sp. JP-L1 TaxID=2715753 RepID=UPI001408885E|nr:HIT family protein [Halorubellus sp. JP-L1]NHN41780.1 HIT family protein [Halorubellus sp. JP-L1]